jgi:hypothetical protein
MANAQFPPRSKLMIAKATLGTLALLATVCLPIAAAKAATYNWSYSDGSNSGSGTLTTGGASAFPGGFIVTAITGTFDSNTITPTVPDASFGSPDNVFYPSGCSSSQSNCPGGGFLVDGAGLSFDTSTTMVRIFDVLTNGSTGGYGAVVSNPMTTFGPRRFRSRPPLALSRSPPHSRSSPAASLD